MQKRVSEDFVPFVQNTLVVPITKGDFLTAVIVPLAVVGGVGNAADKDLELFKVVINLNCLLHPDLLLKQLPRPSLTCFASHCHPPPAQALDYRLLRLVLDSNPAGCTGLSGSALRLK